MQLTRWVMAAAALAATAVACAVGVSDNGVYRIYSGEREPAPIDENVRIVPPPTGGVLQARIRTPRDRYHTGDPIRIEFGVNRDSWAFIFHTDARGITRMLFPNYYDTDNYLRAGKTYHIPDRGYDLEVVGPTGRENLTIVAVEEPWPLLNDYRVFTASDPFPAWRDGAVGLVRRLENFRREPGPWGIYPVRPVPKENLYGSDDTSFYVMHTGVETYKVPRYGTLDIDSYPSNARIYIDGEYYGRTPQVITRLPIGIHNLKLEKEGYLPYEGNFYTKGNETRTLDLWLKQTPVEAGYSRSAGTGGGPAGPEGAACPPVQEQPSAALSCPPVQPIAPPPPPVNRTTEK